MTKTTVTSIYNKELNSNYILGTLTKDKIREYYKNNTIAIYEYLHWMETFEDDNNNEEMPTLD